MGSGIVKKYYRQLQISDLLRKQTFFLPAPRALHCAAHDPSACLAPIRHQSSLCACVCVFKRAHPVEERRSAQSHDYTGRCFSSRKRIHEIRAVALERLLNEKVNEIRTEVVVAVVAYTPQRVNSPLNVLKQIRHNFLMVKAN